MGVLKGKYATCPLKKRPLSLEYEGTEEGGVDEQTEPEDLSVRCGREVPSFPLPEAPPTRTQDTCASETPAQDTGAQYQQMHGADTRDGDHTNAEGDTRTETCPLLQMSPRPQDAQQEGHTQIHTSVCRSSPPPSTPTSHDSHSLVLSGKVPLPGPGAESSHVRAMQALGTRLDARPTDRGSHATIVNNNSNCSNSLKPEEYRTPGDLRDKVITQQPSASPGLAPPLLGWDSPRMHGGSVEQTTGPAGHLMTRRQRFSEPSEAGRAQEHNPVPVAASRPHRPWLTEDPPRQTLFRSFPNLASAPHPERQRNLITTANLWNGIMPMTWPLPHMLPPNPPSSPGRQARECGSPGSESASSEGSSGGGRGEARYSCTDCRRSYSTYSGLSKHKQFHCAALGAKSFACKHCEKVYTSLGALKMHIRTHTLPCKCHLCGKAFSRPWLLQGHIRTHTGEKPFQCSQCDRCFADRSNLRAHLQTHADVKKYACGTCHKTFSRMSLLNKHTEAACPSIHRSGHP